MAWGGVWVAIRREHALRDRTARVYVDEHDLHKRRRVFEAAIGADARTRHSALKHIAHALGEVPGVHGVFPIISRNGAVKEVADNELLVYTNAYLALVDCLFEPADRVYRRRRETGFVTVLRGQRKAQQFIPIF